MSQCYTLFSGYFNWANEAFYESTVSHILKTGKKMLKLFLINQSTEETSEKALIAQQEFSSLSL